MSTAFDDAERNATISYAEYQCCSSFVFCVNGDAIERQTDIQVNFSTEGGGNMDEIIKELEHYVKKLEEEKLIDELKVVAKVARNLFLTSR